MKRYKSKFEENEKKYIVFLPVVRGSNTQIDLDSQLFRVYTDEEYDRIKPYKKVGTYTASHEFSSLPVAKTYVDLVRSVAGNLRNWKKVRDFEDRNKI